MSQTTIRAPFGRLKCCWKQESHTVSIQRVHWNWKTRRQLIKENKSTVFLIIYKYDITSNNFSIHKKLERNWYFKTHHIGSWEFWFILTKYIQHLHYDISIRIIYDLLYLLFWGTVLFLTNCALPVMGSRVTGLIL